MKAIRKYLDKTLEAVTIVLLLVMVTVTSWQVISRYLLNNPSSVTDEFLRYGLIWFSLLAGAYVVGKRSHIAITFLRDYIKTEQKKHWIDIAVNISFLLLAVVMVTGGINAMTLTMAQISPSLNLPMGYVYLSLPVGGMIIFIYALLNLFEVKQTHTQPQANS
ncbi:TRAP transporter small permease [Gracilibacillus xinjiangensis]|uniref:TRAP transporter small permease n=1 Tax=Gracilibacillus xinjiangensis TaxID=1193282 RepID=A0ABV8WSC1_9BACI